MKHLRRTIVATAFAALMGIFGAAQEASAGGYYKYGGFNGGYYGFSSSHRGLGHRRHGFNRFGFSGRHGFGGSRHRFNRFGGFRNRGFRNRGFSRRGFRRH